MTTRSSQKKSKQPSLSSDRSEQMFSSNSSTKETESPQVKKKINQISSVQRWLTTKPSFIPKKKTTKPFPSTTVYMTII